MISVQVYDWSGAEDAAEAQYMESTGEMDSALHFYTIAKGCIT